MKRYDFEGRLCETVTGEWVRHSDIATRIALMDEMVEVWRNGSRPLSIDDFVKIEDIVNKFCEIKGVK